MDGTLGDVVENSDVIPCEAEAGAKLLDLIENCTGRSELCCSEQKVTATLEGRW